MSSIRVDHDENVVTITIDRPDRKNALDAVSFLDLGDQLRQLARAEARAVVPCGSCS